MRCVRGSLCYVENLCMNSFSTARVEDDCPIILFVCCCFVLFCFVCLLVFLATFKLQRISFNTANRIRSFRYVKLRYQFDSLENQQTHLRTDCNSHCVFNMDSDLHSKYRRPTYNCIIFFGGGGIPFSCFAISKYHLNVFIA